MLRYYFFILVIFSILLTVKANLMNYGVDSCGSKYPRIVAVANLGDYKIPAIIFRDVKECDKLDKLIGEKIVESGNFQKFWNSLTELDKCAIQDCNDVFSKNDNYKCENPRKEYRSCMRLKLDNSINLSYRIFADPSYCNLEKCKIDSEERTKYNTAIEYYCVENYCPSMSNWGGDH
jgi:hypothetical protein